MQSRQSSAFTAGSTDQPLYDGRYDDTPASRARLTKPSAPRRPLLVAASGHAERQSGHVTAAVPLVRTYIPKHSA